MKPSQPADWLLFSPKLELATTGTELGLHHGYLLLIGNPLFRSFVVTEVFFPEFFQQTLY